jgi:ubiquinone/menaquinone biosynthesis C-methylase UbiE
LEIVPEPHAPSAEHVAAFYDDTTAVELLFGESIHLGYWPEGEEKDTPLPQAQDRLTALVAARSGAGSGLHVLDVGCGTGGPARHLAHATGATVTGITLSPEQVEVATARSLRDGLDGRTRFQVADAAGLPFADRSFDAAIAIESLLHMPDKDSALREVFRVLRPGAVLTIADVTQRTPRSVAATDSTAFMHSLLAAVSQDMYARLATRAGFVVEDILAIGEETKHSYRKVLERIAGQRSKLNAVCGEERISTLEEAVGQLDSAADRGELGYILLNARKPPEGRR